MRKPIRCKQDNNLAMRSGLLGNHLRYWMSRQELITSGYRDTVSVRSLHVSGQSRYRVPVAQVLEEEQSGVYFNETAPDHLLTLQGDLMRTPKGFALFYSTLPLPMKAALSERGEHAFGVQVLQLLRCHLSPASFDDLMELVDLYDDHIIEFSTYARDIGACRGRNTVIWEVRQY